MLDRGRLRRNGSGSWSSHLSIYCIYTILHSNELRRQAAAGGHHSLTERTSWRTGSHLWVDAKECGERMPVVFSGADDITGLFYWAIIDEIAVDYEKRQTTCLYSNLREISPPRQLSALRLHPPGLSHLEP
jgi:hypothetical protein